MKEKLSSLIESLFSIFIIIAIAGGGIVFLMFLIGIIVGGNLGNMLALKARNVMMPMFIRSAALAIFFGLMHYYLVGNHALTMNENK